MIDEKHLLALLKLWRKQIEERGTHWDGSQWLGRVIEEINIMPKIGEWIPCSERLPDTGTEVLVTLGYTYESDYTMYSIARHIKFEDGECHWRDNRYGYLEWDEYSDGRGGSSSYKVIAWQPLPEPYKEAEQ